MQNHNETEAEILQTILDNDLGLDEEIVMLIKDSLSKRAKKEKEDYSFGQKQQIK